jgi:hypothetical protein
VIPQAVKAADLSGSEPARRWRRRRHEQQHPHQQQNGADAGRRLVRPPDDDNGGCFVSFDQLDGDGVYGGDLAAGQVVMVLIGTRFLDKWVPGPAVFQH